MMAAQRMQSSNQKRVANSKDLPNLTSVNTPRLLHVCATIVTGYSPITAFHMRPGYISGPRTLSSRSLHRCTRTDAMKRLRTAEFATVVTYALITKVAPSWRGLRGYRELLDLRKETVALKSAV
jgi:hypothetical protein